MSDVGTFGYGQFGLSDSTDEFNVMEFIIRMSIMRIVTMKVCKVVKVTPGAAGEGGAPGVAGTVDVLPLVNQVDGNNNATPHGVVHTLPYLRIQSGKWAVVANPVVDEIGIVVCSDRDTSAVRSTKAQANPGSRRTFDLADGVYIGGILNPAPEAYVELKADGTFKISDVNGNVLETGSDGFTLTGNLTVNGTALVTGTLDSNAEITAYKNTGGFVRVAAHLHTTGFPGSPTSAPTPGS